MTSSGDFNVAAAGALVLGGIAALVLATVIALGGYGRPRSPAPPVASAAASTLPAAGGALPDAEVEYPLDTTEPTSPPAQRQP